MPETSRSIPPPCRIRFVLALLLFALVFALFSPSLGYELVNLDDTTYISNNALIHNGLSASSIRQAFSLNNASATMYMPLLWISYMLDVEWLGATPDQPWGFHFTNVLLHALNAVLLYLLLLSFCQSPWRAFFLAAFWALHPLRVESVAWATERKDVLSAFFALLCLGAYVRSVAARPGPGSRPALPLYLASLLFFALVLLAKPALAPIPVVLLLLDFWPLRRMEWTFHSLLQTGPRILLEKLPFLLLAGVAASGVVFTHDAVTGEVPLPLQYRLFFLPLVYGFYLLKSVLPVGLTVLYPPFPAWLPPIWVYALSLLSLLLLLGLSWRVWQNRNQSAHQWIGWLWFLGMLLPVSGLVPFPDVQVADRFAYLATIGLSISALFLLPSRPRVSPAGRWQRPALAASVLLALSLLTLRQLPAWKNTSALYERILAVFPRHATALESRAAQLMRDQGDFQQADLLVSKALQIEPTHWKALLTKAQCVSFLEGPAAAQRLLQQASPPTPLFTRIQWERDLARYALMLGQYDDAIQRADLALSLLPRHDLLRIPILLLAMSAAHDKGDMPQALSYARQFPPYAEKTSLELADLLPHFLYQWFGGHRQDTLAFYQRLMLAYPDRLEFLNNIVWGLATADWSPANPQEVLGMARHLSEQIPNPHPGILDTLAAAQANAGDFASATRTLQNALALFPPDGDANLLAFKERLAFRLILYQHQRPYREKAFDRLYQSFFVQWAARSGAGFQ